MEFLFASDEWQVLMDNLPNLPFATWESFYATAISTVLALVGAGLVLVGLVKGAERIVREMFGL